jgi:hypothetical protein
LSFFSNELDKVVLPTGCPIRLVLHVLVTQDPEVTEIAVRTFSRLRITDKGDWTELTEISIGSGPPRKLVELTVRREK